MIKILNLTKKLAECNTYIQQLENKNELLEQHIELAEQQHEAEEAQRQKAAKQQEASAASRYEQRKEAYLRPVREMAEFIGREYEFRHNVVLDSYEYRRRCKQPDGGNAANGTAAESMADGATAESVADGGWLPVDMRTAATRATALLRRARPTALLRRTRPTARSRRAWPTAGGCPSTSGR